MLRALTTVFALTLFSLLLGQSRGRQRIRTVVLKTSKGDLKIELFADKSPITVENFLSYVKDGTLQRYGVPSCDPEAS